MIIDKDKRDKIKNIVKRHHLLFTLKILGPEALSEDDRKFLESLGVDVRGEPTEDAAKDAYDIGLTRSEIIEGGQENISLEEFRSKPKPYITEEMSYAIEHVKSQMVSSTSKLYSVIQNDVDNSIRTKNIDYRNFLMDNITAPVVVQGIERSKSVAEIATELRKKTDDWNRDWKRVVVTELNNAYSNGIADAIRNRSDVPSSQILVFKRVVEDEALCSQCRTAYLEADGVTPKVFTLEELSANGDNVGLPRADRKPVIGAYHPNCRCRLIHLPRGFGINDDGKMIFVGPDFQYFKSK